MTITEYAPNATISTHFHLRFRSFDEWKDFVIAWLQASGSSSNYHRAVASAFNQVIESFPMDGGESSS